MDNISYMIGCVKSFPNEILTYPSEKHLGVNLYYYFQDSNYPIVQQTIELYLLRISILLFRKEFLCFSACPTKDVIRWLLTTMNHIPV